MATQSAFPFDDQLSNRSQSNHHHHHHQMRSNTDGSTNFDLNTAASLGDLKLIQNILQNPNW